MPNGNNYALGDSASERDRLRNQAERLKKITERYLEDAGIIPGMHVLELGCGPGHVTRLLSDCVGPQGNVAALDRSSAMLDEARQLLHQQQFSNVRFIECDISQLPQLGDRPFDALFGRLILTHVTDPIEVLKRALVHLRPGGVVAFQEADFTLSDHLLAQNNHLLPLTNQVCKWINQAQEGTTRNPHMGLHLYHVFQHAGLPPPIIHLHTELYGGVSPLRIRNTITLLRNLLPRLQELGVSAAQIDLDTLQKRLTAEISAGNVVQAHASIVDAWTVKS